MTNVIACIDGSKVTLAVCDASSWAAQQLDTSVTLLHVLDKSAYPIESNLSGNIGLGTREHLLNEMVELEARRGKLALEQGKYMLQDAQTRIVEAQPAVVVETLQRHGDLVETLLEQESHARLVVMGRQGEQHQDQTQAIGSHLENVIRTLKQPILVVMDEFTAPTRFMIAYDSSVTARKALDRVVSSPLLKGLECHLVMVSDDQSLATAELALVAESLIAADFNVVTAVCQGEVQTALEIYQLEHQIDLMVMGAYCHSRIREFFVGSNTTRMISKSHIPLLLLR
ncbi:MULTISPECIES: universal stress protein [unclassified Shewanella]|uniref:universal stress protein n=1 Tax=Shewanella TaxID=22 RepID=UPI0021D86D26|nr:MULTISPECIES: universal stress protein [unclassified Shewanella]MCU8044940.1 universal stress protein [Shewanella sp. SM68]MCU8049226.1 universal stress protein [Shewanella sp. SM65]